MDGILTAKVKREEYPLRFHIHPEHLDLEQITPIG